MSAFHVVLLCHSVALAVNGEDELDPVSRLAVLECAGLALEKVYANVDELERDAADGCAATIQRLIAAARKAMPEDAWAAAVGHSIQAGPGAARIADLVVLLS